MTYQPELFEALLSRLEQYGPQEGVNTTSLDSMIIIRESESHAKIRTVYEPFSAHWWTGGKRIVTSASRSMNTG